MAGKANGRMLFQALRFRVEEVFQNLADGNRLRRHIVRHPGAVVILPKVDEDHICLIETFRPAVNRWLIELPAGTLEPNEPPLETASRELIEETGYTAQKMTKIHTFCMSPGILDEQMHFFVAEDLSYEAPAREVGEEMKNVVCSMAQVDRLIRDGQILDAKTLVALLWYFRYRTHA